MKHPYLYGFLKGLCCNIIFILIFAILDLRAPRIAHRASIDLSVTIFYIVIEFYLVRKTKLPQAYYLVAVIFNFLFLPFLVGSIYASKSEAAAKN